MTFGKFLFFYQIFIFYIYLLYSIQKDQFFLIKKSYLYHFLELYIFNYITYTYKSYFFNYLKQNQPIIDLTYFYHLKSFNNNSISKFKKYRIFISIFSTIFYFIYYDLKFQPKYFYDSTTSFVIDIQFKILII